MFKRLLGVSLVVSNLLAFQVKNCDSGEVQLNLNAVGDFNVSEGNFTTTKGLINSPEGGGYFKVKPKDINTSYALQVGGDVYITGDIIYKGKLKADKPTLDIETSKTITETNGDQTLEIKVKLSQKLDDDVTFKFQTKEGSGDDGALEDEDYKKVDDTFTIKAGETETTIKITIKGDDTFEYDDKFTAVISDPSDNASIGDDTCKITIDNDDDKPTIKVKDDVSAKEDTDPDFEVDLSAAAGVPVTFHIKMSHDTTDDNDFEGDSPLDADFTIDKGDTSKKVKVDVKDDDDDEDDENYYFEITDADNATIDDDNKKKKGTIEDNDGGGWGLSDKNLKTDIHTLDDALFKIMKLRGVEFHWKKKGWSKHQKYGVIAQELQRVYPEMVIKRKDGYLQVNYQALIAPLIESVKSLKRENDKLKKDLNNLNQRVMKLEKLLQKR